MSTEKPTVKFGRFLEMWGVRAVLQNVTDHPRLGSVPEVYTSNVLNIEHDQDGEVVKVETLNTTYVKEAA
jgi:hypothetical protein